MAKYCSICGTKGTLSNPCTALANNDFICISCFEKTGEKFKGGRQAVELSKTPIEDIKARIAAKTKNTNLTEEFSATKRVSNYLEIDENSRQWRIPSKKLIKKEEPWIFNFDDITSFELVENGNTITSGGLGAALGGGLMFGTVGAIVGSNVGKRKNLATCESLKIKIVLNSLHMPVIYISFIENMSVQKNSPVYKQNFNSAQECLSLLEIICNNRSKDPLSVGTLNSNADEIMKYKKLLDCGAITSEEFEAKKKQLLGF